jgi:hypothetical protein
MNMEKLRLIKASKKRHLEIVQEFIKVEIDINI